MILRFYRVKNKLYPCWDNVFSYSVKPNEALKAVSDIFFIISDKTMSRYSREPIKKNNEMIEALSHSVF